MILSLHVERLRTPEQIRAFLNGSEPMDFNPVSRDEAYAFVSRTLSRFGYARLGKPDRGLVKGFLAKATGLSRAQLTRLVRQFLTTGRIAVRRGGPSSARHTAADIRLLAEADATLGQMAGPATREVMRRECEVYGDARFVRLAHVSIGHLYNLRKSTTYLRKRTVLDRIRPTRVSIGERRRPRPDGRPGFVRVDTVHQGDLDGNKGVYLINVVAPTACGRRSPSSNTSVPSRPSPNASWSRSSKASSTCSRSRSSAFTPTTAPSTSTTASPRCSRSCTPSSPSPAPGIPTTTPSPKARTPAWCASGSATTTSRSASRRSSTGSRATRCRRPSTSTGPACSRSSRPTTTDDCASATPHDAVMTPYERFKSLDAAERFLKPGVTFGNLDKTAHAVSDLAAMRDVDRARDALFRAIGAAHDAAKVA